MYGLHQMWWPHAGVITISGQKYLEGLGYMGENVVITLHLWGCLVERAIRFIAYVIVGSHKYCTAVPTV